MRLLLIIINIFIFQISIAQVGIGTNSPNASSVLDIESSTKGFLPPRMSKTERNQINSGNIAEGLLIYNTTEDCINFYNGNNWKSLCNNADITLDCIGKTFGSGSFTENVSLTGSSHTVTIPFTNASNITLPSTISVTGGDVTNLTATLTTSANPTGAGNIVYEISGTPTGVGTANFELTIGSETCLIQKSVHAPIPNNVTLSIDVVKYISSVYDEDYLPYQVPTTLADTGKVDANGSLNPLINKQGVLDQVNGIEVKIGYSVSTAATITIPAFSETKTVSSDYIQGPILNSNEGGGNPVNVILSYPTQSISGSGTFNATIKAVSTDLNVVKLDINAGLGTDIGILLAEFPIPTDNNGNTDYVQLRAVSGIPDRMFGLPSNDGDMNEHNFLYLPVQSANSTIWLNNNLGANYSNINHPEYDIDQQAKTSGDYHAYGSHIQWGRKTDGHELTNFTGSTAGTMVNLNTTTNMDIPNHSLFITGSPYDWRVTPNTSLWTGENAVNAVCPKGYRLPDLAELTAEKDNWNSPDAAGALASNLRLPTAGLRRTNAGTVEPGTTGFYWSSTPAGIESRDLKFNSSITLDDHERGQGFSVRCIKD